MLQYDYDEEIERNTGVETRNILMKMLHSGEENVSDLEIVGTECGSTEYETVNNEGKRKIVFVVLEDLKPKINQS